MHGHSRMPYIHFQQFSNWADKGEREYSLSLHSVFNIRVCRNISIGGDILKFLNYFKNRTVLGITCIVLALIICFVVSPLVSNTGDKTVTVVRVMSDIKSGDEITKDMVSEVKMSGINQPAQGGATPPPIPQVMYNVALYGQATGPFDLATLKQMAIDGQFNGNSLVWKAGMPAWVAAETVEELKDTLANVMPPIPQ